MLLISAAIVFLAPVLFFGWYQFKNRAEDPIEKIKDHFIPGIEETIGEVILDFAERKDLDVEREGFKPSWGAEEISKDVWLVSYVFEVGRDATSISWEIDMKSGTVQPKDELAAELWFGRQTQIRNNTSD